MNKWLRLVIPIFAVIAMQHLQLDLSNQETFIVCVVYFLGLVELCASKALMLQDIFAAMFTNLLVQMLLQVKTSSNNSDRTLSSRLLCFAIPVWAVTA